MRRRELPDLLKEPRACPLRWATVERPLPLSLFPLRLLDRAVVVAVIAVRVVQVAADEVVGVVAVRHRLVAATRAMPMALVVLAAVVARGAGSRVGAID